MQAAQMHIKIIDETVLNYNWMVKKFVAPVDLISILAIINTHTQTPFISLLDVKCPQVGVALARRPNAEQYTVFTERNCIPLLRDM